MNTELLLKIRDKILEEPENFIMAAWHCGTAHCIAGWAIIMSHIQPDPWHISEAAAAELELSETDSELLFHEEYWPPQFRKPCTVAGQRAKQAAARIMHFIQTDGRE